MGKATADLLLGSVEFVGTATVRAQVGEVVGEEDIDVEADAPEPDIAVSPESLDFGDVAVGSDSDLVLALENSGDDLLIVSELILTGTGFSLPSPPALPSEIPEGGSKAVTVRFSPTEAGLETGTLEIRSNDPQEGRLVVSLKGSGS
jgi:hypothetical protein